MSRPVCWATPRSIIWKSSRVTCPEQLQVTRMPPGVEQFDGQAIQPVVGPQGLVHRPAAAGELGRIEDHGVEALAGRQRRASRVRKPSPVWKRSVGQAVAGGIFLGQGHGLGAGIDAQGLAGPAQGHGGQAETAACSRTCPAPGGREDTRPPPGGSPADRGTAPSSDPRPDRRRIAGRARGRGSGCSGMVPQYGPS